jgi:hypothetical protein
MWRSSWIVVLTFSSCLGLVAQVKSIQGSAGKLVTERPSPPPAPKPASDALTNNDVIELVSVGLGDELIIQKIQSAPLTNFDTSIVGLKSLKSARVSDSVIRVMLTLHGPVANITHIAGPFDNSLPNEVGVYVLIHGKLNEVEPEIVGWQTGGVLKTLATVGFDKGHVNGKIMKPRSPLQVANPVEFVIRTPEGTSVTEYQLLQLYEKDNRRGFRALTGGVFHATGGAERTALPFKSEKIGERTWRIQLQNLSRGEYGFLPPGVSSASISSSGKMYTFGIKE